MIIVRGIHNLKIPEIRKIGLCLSLGNFDGLHIGHQRIIRQMQKRASQINGMSVVFKFYPHPRQVLTPLVPFSLLTTFREQVSLLSQWNLDMLFIARFNKDFAMMAPEGFVKEILINILSVKELFVGEDFCFGHNKSGDLDFLYKMGEIYDFRVHRIGLVKKNGQVISSSLIRQKIQSGEIQCANKLLGREYSLTGTVVRGSGRGRCLGYPTANLQANSKVLPPKGVYIVRVKKQGGAYFGLANLGSKPTFGKGEKKGVEVHILDLNEDLYNKKVTIYFQKWLRGEITFPAPQDLIVQIRKDIDKVNKWKTNHSICPKKGLPLIM